MAYPQTASFVFLQRCKWIFFACIAAAFSIFFLFLFIFQQQENKHVATEITKAVSYREVKAPHLEGLFVKTSSAAFPLPLRQIEESIELLALSDRPDRREDRKARFLLGIKGTKEEVRVLSEDVVYLTLHEEANSNHTIRFASFPSPVQVIPYLDHGEPKMRIRILLVSGGTTYLSKEWEVRLSKGNRRVKMPAQMQEVAEIIDELQSYKEDRLIALYGGDAYHHQKHAWRVEHLGSIFFLDDELFLSVEDGRLKEVTPKQRAALPLLRLTKQEDTLFIEAWDSSGLYKIEKRVTPQKGSLDKIDLSKIFTRMRKRTQSAISCLIAGLPSVLHKGDWLLHKDGKWHVIASQTELQEYLQSTSLGELFIFDDVKKVDGEVCLVGNLFDSSRSVKQYVTLPLYEKQPQTQEEPQKQPQQLNEVDHALLDFEYFDLDF